MMDTAVPTTIMRHTCATLNTTRAVPGAPTAPPARQRSHSLNAVPTNALCILTVVLSPLFTRSELAEGPHSVIKSTLNVRSHRPDWKIQSETWTIPTLNVFTDQKVEKFNTRRLRVAIVFELQQFITSLKRTSHAPMLMFLLWYRQFGLL